MTNDPLVAAGHPGNPRSDLVAQVYLRTRTIIDAELQRLARRVSLDRADLDVIDTALEELAESLILGRLRSTEPRNVALLTSLFSTPTRSRDA